MSGDRPPFVVEVHDATRRLPPERVDWLAHRAMDAGRVLRAAGEVRVRVVGDAEMAAAHERYGGMPGTTDVLTFNLGDEPASPPPTEVDGSLLADYDSNMFVFDSDILICHDEAQRQSGRLGHPIEAELLLYVVHGMLHCLGFGDDTEQAAQAMHRVEDWVLGRVGVGPVFAPKGQSHEG